VAAAHKWSATVRNQAVHVARATIELLCIPAILTRKTAAGLAADARIRQARAETSLPRLQIGSH